MSYIEKREDDIKQAFWARFKVLYPAYFVLSHQEVRKAGYPDNSVSGYAKTSWWEFKHATPNFLSPMIQEMTCARLARFSYCRYIIFYESREQLQTLIYHPRMILGNKGVFKLLGEFEVCFNGFAFDDVAAFINNVHHQ
jgi:hypothetical protein